ncbi:NmrA family transcriptional regulator [Actinoplanes sp. NPDC051861]|uniref:NmrA family transcriptional regulator n=1 Tax=Actinoplanes sp. NPDC051861 TaxID=3155170 RepID=UPI00341D0946
MTEILVLGARGKTGRRVVERLSAAGHAYRAVGRPVFSWEDRGTWSSVLTGVVSAYIVHPELAAPGVSDMIEAFAKRAKAAGVRRLVLLSGRGEAGAERCEEVVAASGLDHTLVRASWFAQNYTEGLLVPSVEAGLIALPAGDVGEPIVDADDIADVAVAALTTDGHSGRLYDVTGPRLLTFAEMAAEISAAAGKPVGYAPVDPETFRAALVPMVGPEQADMLTQLCAEVFDGRNEKVGNGVREALGRPPRDFTDFCANAWTA